MRTQNKSVFAAGFIVAAFAALFSFTVASTSAYQAVAKSDLTITNVQSNQNVTSEYIDLTVTVANDGSKASRSSWVGIYVNDQFRRSCAVPALNPVQQTSVSCRYYFAPNESTHAMVPATFFVDDMEEIWESDETNNKFRFNSTLQNQPVVENSNAIFFPNHANYVAIPSPVATTISYVQPTYVDQQSVCANCFKQQAPTHIQDSYTRYGQNDLYQYDPNARIYTVKTNENQVACPFGTNRSCIQAQTFGQNNATGECRSFETTCLPTTGWTRVARCESNTSTSTSATQAQEEEFITRTDEHFAVYNGQLSLGQLIDVNVGDTVQAEVALMEIDNTKRNFVYQNISNNFSLETIDFPEDAVRCWTNQKSSGTTVYCRGQETNTSIQYELRARTQGTAPIFSRVQYDLNGQKIEREGTQNFQIN